MISSFISRQLLVATVRTSNLAVNQPSSLTGPLIHQTKNIGSQLSLKNKFSFSEYFEKKDREQVRQYTIKKHQNKFYRDLLRLWKRPLEKKRARQQRIRQIKANLKQKQRQAEKLIVHNGAVGIQYPPSPNQIFCIIKVDDFQYKVTKDCVLILDTKPYHEINKEVLIHFYRKITFEVLLAGTPTYTILGRPLVNNTHVIGTVESISDSSKTLVFKKKRRKQYKKSFGSRVSLTSVRVSNIVHSLTEKTLSHAVNLIGSNNEVIEDSGKTQIKQNQ